jgi:hypothetical protein
MPGKCFPQTKAKSIQSQMETNHTQAMHSEISAASKPWNYFSAFVSNGRPLDLPGNPRLFSRRNPYWNEETGRTSAQHALAALAWEATAMSCMTECPKTALMTFWIEATNKNWPIVKIALRNQFRAAAIIARRNYERG